MNANHPQWAIKYVHKSKIHAVKIVNWEDHSEVATVPDVWQFNGKNSDGAKAANLIAAAPELLEALEILVNGAYKSANKDHYAVFTAEELSRANAAIAKAKAA